MTPWGMPAFGPPDALVAVLIVGACYTDVREMKIKNVLTFPIMLAGSLLLIRYGAHPWDGVLGVLAGLVACLPFYAFGRALSAGDVKMLMAAGALLGPEIAIRATLFSVALVLPVAIVMLTVKKRWSQFAAVLRKDAPATMMFHAPVISIAIVLARVQPAPDVFANY